MKNSVIIGVAMAIQDENQRDLTVYAMVTRAEMTSREECYVNFCFFRIKKRCFSGSDEKGVLTWYGPGSCGRRPVQAPGSRQDLAARAKKEDRQRRLGGTPHIFIMSLRAQIFFKDSHKTGDNYG